MDFSLTVVAPGGPPTEVALHARPGHRVRELRAALSEEFARPVPTLWCGGQAVDDDLLVGHPPILQGAIVTLAPPGPRHAAGTGSGIQLAVVGGPDSGRILPLGHGSHIVGRGGADHLTLADPALSRSHLRIEVTSSGVVVHDLATTNGTWVAGAQLKAGGARLVPGDLVVAGASSLQIQILHHRPARTQAPGDGTLRLSRTPRTPHSSPAAPITVPVRPSEPEPSEVPWLAMAVPLPIGVLLALALGPRMLLFGLLSPVMLAAHTVNERWSRRRRFRRDHRRYTAVIDQVHRELTQRGAEELADLRVRYPDPAEVLALASEPSVRLWERSKDHADALVIRIGTGSREPSAQILGPGDGLRVPLLHDAPIVLDLGSQGPVAITGRSRETEAVLSLWVGQLLTQLPPSDLEVVLIADEAGWTRAPHVRAASLAEATTVVEVRSADRSPGQSNQSWPIVVVVIPRIEGLSQSDGLDRLLSRGPAVRVHTLIGAADAAAVPAGCRTTIPTASSRPASAPRLDVPGLRLDAVGPWWAERLGRALAPLRDAHATGSVTVPHEARLLDLLRQDATDPLDAQATRRRWTSRSVDSRQGQALVGIGRDGPWRLDLPTDGPHVLVAGTTGSGKSEFLQTLVMSLAVTHPPEELSFILVDYKGGSAFQDCARLPHVSGLVTDLDPHLTQRALASLGAEVRRRERLFASANVMDLDAYRRARRLSDPVVGRLVVVIDEFRMLVDELPGFVAALVRLAAVGRSLGIHLVLATQRPAGVITADMRANINLRIALRVRDRDDSQDVLDSGHAVGIHPKHPGRFFARRGGRELVEVQAARVGGPPTSTTSDLTVCRALPDGVEGSPSASRNTSDLRAIVESLSRAARGLPAAHSPWLPPLPSSVTTADLPSPPPGEVAWGLVDLPQEQDRVALTYAPHTDHHLAIVGTSRSGRSTAIHTLLMSLARCLAPGAVQFHVVSQARGSLVQIAELPHTGSWLDLTDSEPVLRLLRRLDAECTHRFQLLAARGIPDLEAWSRSEDRSSPAVIVLALDGLDRLIEAAPDPTSIVDLVLAIARSGPAVGVNLVATGDKSLLVGRLASALPHRLILRLADPIDAALAGLAPGALPHQPPPGRAVRAADGAEAQVALPPAPPQFVEPAPSGMLRVIPLPWILDQDGLPASADLRLGRGGDDAHLITIGPRCRALVIAGSPGSGKTNAIRLLALEGARQGRPTLVICEDPSSYREDLITAISRSATRPEIERLWPGSGGLVCADDADSMHGTPIGDALIEALDAEDGTQVVLSTDVNRALAHLRGPVATAARSQHAVLLGSYPTAAGDLFGARILRSDNRIAGRGVLLTRGDAQPIQIALARSVVA